MTATLCVLCSRREPTVGLLCTPDADRMARHLDPANLGQPFDPDHPDAPVRPASIPVLYRELVDLRIAAGESEHEHADAAEVDMHRATLADVRSKATGPGPDDDGLAAPPSVIATLGGWARIVHEEHLDLEGRPDPLPVLARPPWLEARSDEGRNIIRVPVTVEAPDVQAVTTLCRWLHARRDWIAGQPWVDEFVADLRRLTAVLNAGRGDPGSRPLGPCPATVDDEGQYAEDGQWTCREPLHLPSMPPRGPGEALAVPSVRCPSCGARWSGLELLAFAAEQGIPVP